MDISRSAKGYTREDGTQNSFVNFTAIEELKNGTFISTKYNTKRMRGPSPHVVIFANFEPDYTVLSKDRWIIGEIDPHGKTIEFKRFVNAYDTDLTVFTPDILK